MGQQNQTQTQQQEQQAPNDDLTNTTVSANSKLLDILDKTLEQSEKKGVESTLEEPSVPAPSSSSESHATKAAPRIYEDATTFLDEFENELSGGSPETNHSLPSSPATMPSAVPKLELENVSDLEPERREDIYSDLGTKNFGLQEPPSPRMLELLLPKQPRSDLDKKIHTINARQSVVDEAFNRMLTKIERETLNDEYTKHKMAELENSHLSTMIKKREEQEKVRVDLQKTLDQQVHEFEERQRKQRDEIKNSKIVSIVENNIDNKMIKVNKDELCGMLMAQINKKEQDAREDREKKLQEEREYLEHVAIELDMQNAADRANHLSKQSELLEAWEREGHVKNLKKLQNSGINAVHGYIRSNLMDGTPDVTTKSYSARSDKSARANMSVGYDPRAGQIKAYSLSEGMRKK